MPSAHETAYPRLKASVTTRDLEEIYTPTPEEVEFAAKHTHPGPSRVCVVVLLKTFQRLGYFVHLRDVPSSIVSHIATCLGMSLEPHELHAYDLSRTRRHHLTAIRAYLHIKPYDGQARQTLAAAIRGAAQTKDTLTDLINIGMEELIRQRFELTGFTTLDRAAEEGRAAVNREVYQRVASQLGPEARQRLDTLFTLDGTTGQALWETIKADPGPATISQLRALVAHLHWLSTLHVDAPALTTVPSIKVQHFAAEAKSLNAARMQRLTPAKRSTLAVALIKVQVARVLDDLGDMFLKRLRTIHHKGEAALEDYRHRQQGRTDQLIAILHDLVTAMQQDASPETCLTAMHQIVGDQAETILEDCQAYAAYGENNYYPFLWRFYKSHRQTLFALLDHVQLRSTSQDTTVEEALAFLRQHRTSKRDWVDLSPTPLDLSWVPDKWWKLVTGTTVRTRRPQWVNRRHFEVCVFSQVMQELKSGDLCIEGSDQFADYREQLISWDEYARTVSDYGEQVGLPVECDAFVTHMRTVLEQTATDVDTSFPTNDGVRLEHDQPILRRLAKRPVPALLIPLRQLIAERLEPVTILDVLTDTDNWLHWTRGFGPLSGYEARIEAARARYVTTTFCYGCNLGPTQTAQSLQLFDRKHIAWINQRHITERKLDAAITELINAYNRFMLPKLWGSGKHAAADGTKWDLYEQNLLAERHIRYGGYGGIGYYHVSDTYVALFSHFIRCGVWEAVYILDGLLKNTSDIQPDTLHADTQGQSTPVFGLAHLLGIHLMPRIRNWKDLTLLRRLGTYSRKNRLYLAFRELGRVVRTAFLLRYLSDAELRQTIHAATNKSEAFNRFVQWLFFEGEGMIASNDRETQRKRIKYNHLIANCVIFHNVHAQTRILHQLAQEGYVFDEEVLAHLSPYLMAHINRFGRYTLDFDREVHAPDYTMSLRPAA